MGCRGICLLITIVASFTVSVNNDANAQNKLLHKLPKKALTERKFLFLSDVHLDPASATTNMGEDAGMDVWRAFTTKVDSIMASPESPEFVLYTGDLPVHYKGAVCTPLAGNELRQHDTAIKLVLQFLADLSRKGKPVFYLPGNNDALNGDYLPFYDSMSGKNTLSLLNTLPNPFFYPGKTHRGPVHYIDDHSDLGYYSIQIESGLRLIALNTVMYNVNCADIYLPEAAQQMDWLKQQLASARRAGNKVFLAMHIPPGKDYSGNPMWNSNGQNWTNVFLELCDKYSSTIAGTLYGHTHMDEVRRFFNTNGTKVTEVAISCPGVSAQHRNNPGFKTVTYNAKSKELTGFTTFYTTLPVNGAQWNGQYTSASKLGISNTTIYNGLKNMNISLLAQKVALIYNVMNGIGDTNILKPQIDVLRQ